MLQHLATAVVELLQVGVAAAVVVLLVKVRVVVVVVDRKSVV